MPFYKGHAKKKAIMEPMPKSCQLWRPTYLPPRSPGTAKSRTQRCRGGRGGSPISRPGLFLLRTCADVLFSLQMPPKPAGDLKTFERANHPSALRARPQPPPSATKRLILAADGQEAGGYRKKLVKFSWAPTYLPTCHGFHAPCTFFLVPIAFCTCSTCSPNTQTPK